MRCLNLVLFLILLSCPAAAQLALIPIDVQVTSQRLALIFGSCPEVTGGADVSLGFNEAGADLTVSGTYTASNVDGRLVLTLSGAANNINPSSRSFTLVGRHALALNVPELLLDAQVLPAATQVASILSYDASDGFNVIGATAFLMHPPGGGAFGGNLYSPSRVCADDCVERVPRLRIFPQCSRLSEG